MLQSAMDHFNKGELATAISLCNDVVKEKPRDLSAKLILVQFLCFTGDWARVSTVLNQIQTLDSDKQHTQLVTFIESLVRAEGDRKAVWTEGLVPEFPDSPDEITKKLLWAWNCLREGNVDDYKSALAVVDESASSVRLMLNGKTYEGFRDLDDMTSIVFEAHSLTGTYFWIPISSIRSISVSKPTRPIDYLWNHARLTMTDDSKLAVYLPALYFHSYDSEETIQLGRETRWENNNIEIEMGLGRKLFTAGDEEFSFFDLEDAQLEVVRG